MERGGESKQEGREKHWGKGERGKHIVPSREEVGRRRERQERGKAV